MHSKCKHYEGMISVSTLIVPVSGFTTYLLFISNTTIVTLKDVTNWIGTSQSKGYICARFGNKMNGHFSFYTIIYTCYKPYKFDELS